MNLYPAIDIYEGQAVRLTRGDYNQKTVYYDLPEDAAVKWTEQGAQWIHLVDLEGAKSGQFKNVEAVRNIRKSVQVRLELGGGIRSESDIDMLLDMGIDRVILGTKALDAVFLEKVLGKYGEKIAVGLDVRDEIVQTQGWLQTRGVTLEKALSFLNQYALETIIYTDIKKDGMLQGPNFKTLDHVLDLTKSNVILSGGVSTLDDIKQCTTIKHPNFEGAIIGKALYENKFSVAEALDLISTHSKGSG